MRLPAVLFLLAAAAACRDASPTPAQATPQPPPQQPAEQAPDGRSVHYSRFRALVPDELAGYRGEQVVASSARFGDVGVSELERTYAGTDGRSAKVKVVDTNINQRARAPTPGRPYEDEHKLGRPLVASGAIGYVEYDKASRRAKADLIVAGRFLVTVTADGASGPDDVERLSAALDLKRLADLAGRLPPAP